MVRMTDFVALRNGGNPNYLGEGSDFNRSKKTKSNTNYLGEKSDFSKPQERKRFGFSDVGNRGSYTPGGDSFKNYSQEDQQTMFKQAGGKDKFIEQAANIEQNYKRSANTQGFLDRTKLFNQFQNRGDSVVRDKFGRQILSMQDPRLTAQAPTFGQLMGDIGRGIGNIAQGFAEKGPPIVQFINALRSGVMDFISPNMQNQMVGTERQVGFGSQELNDFNTLNKSQQNTYLMLKKSGATHKEAFDQSRLQTMAIGGIATLQ